jgi:hypothetical protein
MKKKILTYVILFGITFQIYGQINYNQIDSLKNIIFYKNLDTLKWYAVTLECYNKKKFELPGFGDYKSEIGFNKSLTEMEIDSPKIGFYLNNIKIDENTYKKFKKT